MKDHEEGFRDLNDEEREAIRRLSEGRSNPPEPERLGGAIVGAALVLGLLVILGLWIHAEITEPPVFRRNGDAVFDTQTGETWGVVPKSEAPVDTRDYKWRKYLVPIPK